MSGSQLAHFNEALCFNLIAATLALLQTASAGVIYSFTSDYTGTAWSFLVPSLLTDTTYVAAADLFGVQQPRITPDLGSLFAGWMITEN